MALPKLNDGVYSASSRGYLGDIPVTLTVADGRIADIQVHPNRDSEEFCEYPTYKLPKLIREHQTLNVDVISGATFSSRGILRAVADCVAQAGGDVSQWRKAPPPPTDSKEIITRECDICILGTGGAGTAAAAAATEKGASVVILEKAAFNGGITNSTCFMLAVNSNVQVAAGNVLDMGDIYRHMIQWNHYMSNTRLISKFLHKTASTVEWMQGMGVDMFYGGRAQETEVPDTPVMYPDIANFSARRRQQGLILDHALRRGAEVFYETRAKKLLMEDGAVIGVEAKQDDGTTVIVRSKAVIVATGCYDGNKELAEKYFPYPARLCEPKWLAEGDGLLMCIEAGADTCGLGSRVTHCNTGDRAAMGRGADEQCKTVWQLPNFPAAVFLNYRGQRYTDENLCQNSLAVANANAAQGGSGDFLTFVDTSFIRRLAKEGGHALGVHHVPGGRSLPYLEEGFFANIEEEMAIGEKLGMVVKGDTLEELAEKLNIKPEVLKFEIDRYNTFCHNGSDEDYFKDPSTMFAMEEAPFYVVMGTCDSMGSCGGVRVDDELRVLTPKYETIPGLYCAGACAGDIWGRESYGILEGATCSWAWNSGRMAGENAAEAVLANA